MEILIRNTLNHCWGADSQPPPPPVTGPLGFKHLTDSLKYSVTGLIFLCGVSNHIPTPTVIFLYFTSLATTYQKTLKAKYLETKNSETTNASW